MNQQYISTADQLVERIHALIPTHPEIMEMDDCWNLFKVEGFHCDDLQPTMFQASWALSEAKRRHKV